MENKYIDSTAQQFLKNMTNTEGYVPIKSYKYVEVCRIDSKSY